MINDRCYARTNLRSLFCPNVGAALAFTILFGLTTIAHLIQGFRYGKTLCWLIVASGLAQTIAYVLRVISIFNSAEFAVHAGSFVLISVAPLFINAFVYMVMGRMIWNCVDEKRVYGVTASRFGTYFVVLDICALVIQIIGAVLATGISIHMTHSLEGLHLYMGGLGIQLAIILLFLLFAIKFHHIVRRQNTNLALSASPTHDSTLLYVLYAVLGLIIARIIFRLVEYAFVGAFFGGIRSREAYQYGLDSLPMLIALVLLNIFHPGRIMSGKDSKMPSRKERKLAGLDPEVQ